MNHVRKPDQHYPNPVGKPMLIVFDPERAFDERVCTSPEDAWDFIRGCDVQSGPFKVVEFVLDEGTCRDVTADYLPDDDEAEPFGGDYSHADHFNTMLRRTA